MRVIARLLGAGASPNLQNKVNILFETVYSLCLTFSVYCLLSILVERLDSSLFCLYAGVHWRSQSITQVWRKPKHPEQRKSTGISYILFFKLERLTYNIFVQVGGTALTHAAANGDTEMICLLLREGADRNILDDVSCTCRLHRLRAHSDVSKFTGRKHCAVSRSSGRAREGNRCSAYSPVTRIGERGGYMNDNGSVFGAALLRNL